MSLFIAVSCSKDNTDPTPQPGLNDPNAVLPESPFSISISNTNYQDVCVDVTVEDDSNSYIYTAGIIPAADYETLYHSNTKLVADYIAKTAIKKGADFAIIDNKYVFEGDARVELSSWGALELGEEYMVAVFSVAENGAATTDIVTKTFVTEDLPGLKLSLKGVTMDNIVVDVDITPNFGTYYVVPLPMSIFEYDYNSQCENAVKAAIAEYMSEGATFDEPDNEYWVFDQDATISMAAGWNMSSDTEYIIMAFGVAADGELTSDIYSLEAATLCEVELLEGEFKMSVGDMEPDNVNVTVTKSGDIGNYIVFAYNATAFEDSYYSYAEYLIDDVTYDMVCSGFDFLEPDGVKLFDAETVTLDLKDTFTFYEGETYVVVAAGVDSEGRCNTVPEIIYAQTSYSPEPEVTGSIKMELVGTTKNNIIVSVEEIGAVNSYCVAACPMDNFVADYNSNDDALIADILFSQLADDYALPDGYRVFDESQEQIHLGLGWPISSNREYHVIAFGVSRDKEQNTESVSFNATTPEAPRSEVEIEITCSNVTENGVTIETTATNEDQYYLTLVEADKVAGMSDEEIYKYIVNPYGETFAETVSFYSGNVAPVEYEGLYADTDYFAVAFTYGYGSITSEVFKSETFRTLPIEGEVGTLTADEIELSDVDFGEIIVGDSFQYNLMTITIKPADADMKYLFFLKKSSEMTVGTDEEIIAADYEAIKDAAGYQGMTYAETLNLWLRTGENTSKNGIYASTEYTLYAYGVDTETYQPLTAIKKVVVAVP